MPIATGKVLETMNIDKVNISIDSIKSFDLINSEIELKNSKILFKKIDDDN